MMKKVLSIFIIVTLIHCKAQVKDSSNQNATMEKNSQSIKNQEGIIGYWPSLKKYTVNYSQPNTYDAQYTCIIEGDLDEGFKKEGIKVIFSGKIYKNEQTPQPMLGGQQIFWLKLDSISAK
jgi:hypothetical protein